MKVLSINTSSDNSTAIIVDNQVIAFSNNVYANNLENIYANIDNVLTKAKIMFEDLDVILVALGPGGFTSTRVGITVVKAISTIYPHIRVLGINIFDALYYHHYSSNIYKHVIVILHSVKDRYKFRTYDTNGKVITKLCEMSVDQILIATQSIQMGSLYISPLALPSIEHLSIYDTPSASILFSAYLNKAYETELKQIY